MTSVLQSINYLFHHSQQQRYILFFEENNLSHPPKCKRYHRGVLFLDRCNIRFEYECPKHDLQEKDEFLFG